MIRNRIGADSLRGRGGQDSRIQGFKDSRFKIQDSRFKIQDSRFKNSRFKNSRFKIQDSRFKIQDSQRDQVRMRIIRNGPARNPPAIVEIPDREFLIFRMMESCILNSCMMM